jgi:hypothetical protein
MLDTSVLGAAMGSLDAITDVLLGSKTFDLRVISWRQFLHGVSRGADRQHPDDHRIELQCRLHQSVLEGAIIVGENSTESESLGDIEFSLEIRSAQRVFSEFDEKNPDSDEGKNTVGILMYNAPISSGSLAGLPSSVIEKSKTGSISGWIFHGDSSLAEISRLLMVEPRPEIHIWTTVKAASKATPLSLTYETKMYHPTSYRWEAKNNPLEVTEARVVVTTATVPTKDSAIPEPIVGSSASTVSEAIADSIRSLDTKVGRLGLTIVVLLGAILIELWHRF